MCVSVPLQYNHYRTLGPCTDLNVPSSRMSFSPIQNSWLLFAVKKLFLMYVFSLADSMFSSTAPSRIQLLLAAA